MRQHIDHGILRLLPFKTLKEKKKGGCYTPNLKLACFVCYLIIINTFWTRRFSNHVSRLLLRSHTFAIIVILYLKIHQSMWIHWPFFPKTWTKGHWPQRPLTPCLLSSHVWLYPRIIVSKSHDNTSMYVDTVINFAKFHIHTHTYIFYILYYVQNEWSHSLLLNSVQARQKWYMHLKATYPSN